MNQHPTATQLRKWLDGRLNDADGQAIVAHLATCSVICPGVLDSITRTERPFSQNGASPREQIPPSPPGYEVVGWNGVLAPANTPRPIVDKLNTAILAALKTPEMEKLLSEQGIEPAGNSPEEFARIMHADIEKWMRVTREAGITPQ